MKSPSKAAALRALAAAAALCAAASPRSAAAQQNPAPAPSPGPQAAPAPVVPGQEPPAPALPPPPPGTRVLSLSQAAAAARQNVPTVLSAMARERAAEAQVNLARAGYHPSITGSFGLNATLTNGTFVNGSALVSSSRGSAWGNTSITLRWTIWDFGRTQLAVDAALEGARAAREDARAAERSAVAAAVGAYMIVLADQEAVSASQQIVQQRERELEITRGLVAAGTRAPIEQTRAEVALDQARLTLTTSQGAALNDTAALAGALALDPTHPLVLEAAPAFALDDDPSHAADAAVAARPELAAANARLLQAQALARQARAAYMPTLSTNVSASATYTASGNLDGSGGAPPQPSEQLSAALTLSIPIYDPTIQSNMRVQDANVLAARAAVTQQVLAVRTDAAQAALAVRNARTALEQAERVASGAAANLQQAEGRYAAGVAPLLELVDAQAADASARVGVVQARVQLNLSRVRLLASLGRLDELESRP